MIDQWKWTMEMVVVEDVMADESVPVSWFLNRSKKSIKEPFQSVLCIVSERSLEGTIGIIFLGV